MVTSCTRHRIVDRSQRFPNLGECKIAEALIELAVVRVIPSRTSVATPMSCWSLSTHLRQRILEGLSMINNLKGIGWCRLSILVALYVVGAVSHGSLRHEVQTLALLAKSGAIPCLSLRRL